ncbi:MAG: Holliday junction resolvase [Methanolinea sp.]|nr:Holliday junction resolvase [Methanolinea sp.]
MLGWALLISLLLFIVLLWYYLKLRYTLEKRAGTLFSEWRAERLEQEARERAELLFREWAFSEEERIRKDAARKSEAVIRGKISEHLAPYFPGFPYDARDARFMGTPVDFVVFQGLSSGSLEQIVFVEVKTGRRGSLSMREQQVRECVGKKRVAYEILHLDRKP